MSASTADAKQSVADVQSKVNKLYHQAEQASENYDAAQLRLKALRGELDDLQADQTRQDKALSSVRAELRDSMLRRFEGSSLSAVGQVVVSNDPKSFLAGLSTMTAYDGIESNLLASYNSQVQALSLRQTATQQRVDEVADLEKQLKSDKKEIKVRLSAAQHVLAGLQSSQREAIVSRDDVRMPTVDVPASGRASAALAFAMAQLGKAYAYGGAGDSAYDCSGLTMRAWGAAGVSLPHSSAAQFGTGPHISASDLEPGDLVFYYSPISHVGIYIGNGLIVNAENPAGGVRVQGLYSMPYVGAVRPG